MFFKWLCQESQRDTGESKPSVSRTLQFRLPPLFLASSLYPFFDCEILTIIVANFPLFLPLPDLLDSYLLLFSSPDPQPSRPLLYGAPPTIAPPPSRTNITYLLDPELSNNYVMYTAIHIVPRVDLIMSKEQKNKKLNADV